MQRSAGAARSYEFTPPVEPKRKVTARRWLVWYWDEDCWKRCAAPMPEGACAHYADVDHRHAGAIVMEAM